MSSRSNSLTVRNPLLRLLGMRRLLDEAPPEVREWLRAVALDICEDALERAEESWRRNKAPMAAYWKAVSVYARHVARAMRNPERTTRREAA